MTLAAAPVAWSKSQISALRECKRKHFFQRSDQYSALKKLKNRFLWTGSIVHETIGQLLKELRQGQPVPPIETFIQSARERMRSEFKSSLKSSEAGPRLFEHEYNHVVSSEVWQSQWNGVERSLRRFLESAWLDRLSKIGPECWKAVDEVLSFDVDGIKAFVKIDCGIEVNSEFFIMDWKGSAIRPTDEASLLVAALYAHEVWGADPRAISAVAISLVDGKTLKAEINEESLMETFLKIQEEAALLESETLKKDSDPFSVPAASLNTCERCNFQRICHPAGLGL